MSNFFVFKLTLAYAVIFQLSMDDNENLFKSIAITTASTPSQGIQNNAEPLKRSKKRKSLSLRKKRRKRVKDLTQLHHRNKVLLLQDLENNYSAPNTSRKQIIF